MTNQGGVAVSDTAGSLSSKTVRAVTELSPARGQLILQRVLVATVGNVPAEFGDNAVVLGADQARRDDLLVAYDRVTEIVAVIVDGGQATARRAAITPLYETSTGEAAFGSLRWVEDSVTNLGQIDTDTLGERAVAAEAGYLVGLADRVHVAYRNHLTGVSKQWREAPVPDMASDPHVISSFGTHVAGYHALVALYENISGDHRDVLVWGRQLLATVFDDSYEVLGPSSVALTNPLYREWTDYRLFRRSAGRGLATGARTVARADSSDLTVRATPPLTTRAQVVDAAKALTGRLAAGALDRHRASLRPFEQVRWLSKSGITAIRVPPTHGGLGADSATLTAVLRAVAAGDSSVAQVLLNHFSMANFYAQPDPPEGPYRRMLAGDVFGSWGVDRSRSHKGFRPTVFRAVEGGYSITADRYFCTGLALCDVVVIRGAGDDGSRVSGYLDQTSPGIEIHDDWRAVGQRGTSSGSSTWTDVLMPADQLLDEGTLPPHRYRVYKAQTQLLHAAIEIGILDAALAATAVDTDAWRAAHLTSEAGWALIVRAGEVIDSILAQADVTAPDIATASVAVDEAKVVVYRDVSRAISGLLDADADAGTDREVVEMAWRNARVHSLHDPVRWRIHFVGDYHLNGVTTPYDDSPLRPGE